MVADDNLKLTLDGMKQATTLDFHCSQFGPQAFSALRRHLSSLKELSLGNASGATSATIQEIMCSSPQLEIFRGERILAKDVVEGRSWSAWD